MQFLMVLLDNNIVSEINNIFCLPKKYLLFTVPRDLNPACPRFLPTLFLAFSFFDKSYIEIAQRGMISTQSFFLRCAIYRLLNLLKV